MKIYNTLTQKKELFKPVKDGNVGIYLCGPTVYDVGHLGHARSAVAFDLIRRYFEYKNFKVTFVSNYTDVDDKMIKRAAEEEISEKELADKIIPEYEKDYGALGVKPADVHPKATEYVEHMVLLVERLMKNGAAYESQDGIYFEVSRFAAYGKLSKQNLDELRAGARVAVDDKKRNPEDFALWKKEKPGEPAWNGPNGMRGRPGWHIECSAMSMDILGETFDIHGGGIDLQFPHHEDEIAQSEMATGKPFANYWMHNGHIRVNEEKMSKSLGNFFTIKDMLAKFNPLVIRYFLISSHYRMPVEFSDDLLEQSRNGLERLHDFMRRLRSYSGYGGQSIANKFAHVLQSFDSSMEDDFEISKGLAAIFDFVKELNGFMDSGKLSTSDANAAIAVMNGFDSVLGVLKVEKVGEDSAEIEKLIKERNDARDSKDFARSDEIRDELKASGIILEDRTGGTIWKREL